uniref:YdeI/OmpD-associated family protein n=1 Tax=Microbispora cellulosiformans TaxID=2614688 RepID=UPI001CDA39EF|nr:YdeI/OmpD-associated family protein [Microbispora cellulosiformans]
MDGRLCTAVGSGGPGRPASRDRRRPAAQAMFELLTKTNRFALISRVNAVKRAETRTRKIAEYVAMLARHETIHPQRARPTDPPTS